MKIEYTKEELLNLKALLNRLSKTLTDEESPYKPFKWELMPQIEEQLKKINNELK